MDIKKIFISDKIDDRVIHALRTSNLTVDYNSSLGPQQLLETIQVSLDLLFKLAVKLRKPT